MQNRQLCERPGAANAGAKVTTLIAAMALGADLIDDCDILRSGRTAAVLGHRVVAPSTIGTFLRAFTFGHARQLDRVLGRSIERAWRACAGPGEERLVVDVDSFVGEVHGYHPLLGYVDSFVGEVHGYHPLLGSRADTGEVLHIRLRSSANTARSAALRRGAVRAQIGPVPAVRSCSAPTRASDRTRSSHGLRRRAGATRLGCALDLPPGGTVHSGCSSCSGYYGRISWKAWASCGRPRW